MNSTESRLPRSLRRQSPRLTVPGPPPDSCDMPTGGGLCILPGVHPNTTTCLPQPRTYPPTVTVVACPECHGAGGWQQPDGLIIECPSGCMVGGAA